MFLSHFSQQKGGGFSSSSGGGPHGGSGSGEKGCPEDGDNVISLGRMKRREAIRPGTIDKLDLAKAFEDDPENAFLAALHLKKNISLDQLVQQTHFSRVEVRAVYRVFKEATQGTNAIIHRDIVRNIFTYLFPRGDTEHFADLIFNAFDTDQSGAITFDKFLRALSVLSRGSVEEKLAWLYRLYDPLDSGLVSWHRMCYVLSATEDLIDRRILQRRDSRTREELREKFAQTLCKKFSSIGNRTMNKSEFLDGCRRDPAILSSLHNLNMPF